MIRTRRQDRIPGIIISLIILFIECAFIGLLFYTKFLSVKFIGAIVFILFSTASLRQFL